jgi:hypothetical protein
MRRALLALGFFGVLLVAAPTAAGPDIVLSPTGGPVWAMRTGPGVGGVLGINQCFRDYCNHHWDTLASISATGMFIYRIMPNLAVFVDVHIGHLGADSQYYKNDQGVVFGATGGAEFHLPIGGWFDPYVGFGMGYAFLGLFGEMENVPWLSDIEAKNKLHGLNFEMRFGADFFLLGNVPTFSLGPQFRIGFPLWLTHCWERGDLDDCVQREDFEPRLDGDDSPFLFHFGVAAKYGF